MMEHEEAEQLLPAYMDQELDVVDALAVEHHLARCAACRLELEEQRSASLRTRQGARYFEAPPALQARLMRAMPQASAPRMRPAPLHPYWMQAAAACALIVALAWGIGSDRGGTGQRLLSDELVASHVRSLQVDHLADVASSDRHTVKPWFIGKLDFAPPVVDLAPQGFPLVGGRLDYVGGRDVAVLVYRRSRHPINVYVWPGAELPASPQTTRVQGYRLVRWSAGGMDYAALSDVAEADLAQFVAALRKQAAAL
jgi:anti-sigma factor RsiW